jgi:phospholipid/cholesterol/gamma-HCH transport system substrate-binding protein
MANKAQRIKVGIFVAITAALLAIVLVVFGGIRLWESKSHFTIEFDDSVMGLEKGAQVYLNGIRVGRVDAIEVSPTDLGKVLVTITVASDTPVHTDTKAMLQFAGITGLKVIDLRQGTLAAPLLADGGRIPQGETILDKVQRQATQIADQSEKLMQRAGQIVDNLVALTDPKRYAALDDIVAGAKTTANNLALASAEMRTMVAENRVILKDTLGTVRGAVASTKTIIDTQVTGLVSSASALISDLGNIIHGSEGQLRSTVFDLRQASRNFKELSRDLRARPSRLLFSNPQSERKLP